MAASTDATGVPSDTDKRQLYSTCTSRIVRLIEGEDDLVAVQATVVCELHHAMPHFHWTGFYRAVGPDMLAVGPYQGGSACLRIPHSKGVCGAAATTGDTQLVRDVHTFPGHIACSSSTMSEIVVPVKSSDGRLLAVLDIDSDFPAAFSETDQQALEQLCRCIGGKLYRTGTVEWGGSS